MVDSELESTWRTFISRSRIPEDQAEKILENQGTSKEALREEWTPGAEKRLKSRLLMNKIIEEEKIEIADNEVDEEIERHAEQQDISPEELKERYKQANYIDFIEGDIKDKKLFDFLITCSKVKKGEKVKFLDIMQEGQ
jgi:trigger factor